MTVAHREFGRTGLKVPPIVFGATNLGNLFKALSDREKHDIVHAWLNAFPHPIVIDSAGKYGAGLSLEVIGRELDLANLSTDDVIISNKLAWRRVPLQGPEPTFEPDAWIDLQHDAIQDISHDGILRCWEEGCRLLGDRKPALISVHDPDEYLAAAHDPDDRRQRFQNLLDAYKALEKLRDAGEAIGVGIGAKDWRSIAELAPHCDLDWVMFANSFTIYQHPPELCSFLSSLAHRGVGIINSALFHGGFLVGGNFFDYKPVQPDKPLDAARLEWRSRFWKACQELALSPFDVAVAFGKSHPAIHAIALSSSRADRIPSHVAAASRSLSTDVWKHLHHEGLIDWIPGSSEED